MKAFILEEKRLTGDKHYFDFNKGNLKMIAKKHLNDYREAVDRDQISAGELVSLKIYECEIDESSVEKIYIG